MITTEEMPVVNHIHRHTQPELSEESRKRIEAIATIAIQNIVNSASTAIAVVIDATTTKILTDIHKEESTSE